jgi:hypothetical protein
MIWQAFETLPSSSASWSSESLRLVLSVSFGVFGDGVLLVVFFRAVISIPLG